MRHMRLVESGHDHGSGVVQREFEPAEQLDGILLGVRRDDLLPELVQEETKSLMGGDGRIQLGGKPLKPIEGDACDFCEVTELAVLRAGPVGKRREPTT